MKVDPAIITKEVLVRELLAIREAMLLAEVKYKKMIDEVHPNYTKSARNFLHYLSLRTHKIRPLQQALSALGLSSLGHPERYALANLDSILHFLYLARGESYEPDYSYGNPVDYTEGLEILNTNTNRLLGEGRHQSQTRIMVTLPSEAAGDYALVRDLVRAGMDVARINCSHDSLEDWKQMIANIRKSRKEVARSCLIYMDLAGPKLRTGSVPVTEGKKKKKGKKHKKHKKHKKQKVRDYLSLSQGDKLRIHTLPVEGRDAIHNASGDLVEPAQISITLPAALHNIRKGHRIFFDDGKIAGKIIELHGDHILVEITRTDRKGGKLRAEKGINLPDTLIDLPSLTEEDYTNLPFIAEHADILGYSFVRSAEDVIQLQNALKTLGVPEPGIVLKIETREAFEQFPSIVLTAMRSPSIGVMIARGDLAVELGAERISEVQEELLWLCDAAHIPNIWATQVLEKMAKEGLATRAEITDASMSARAECVMLNKGPYILEVVRTLGNIIERMEAHQYKKEGALRALQVARQFFDTTSGE